MDDTQTAQPRVERFDPITGKLLADAPRFDSATGAHYRDSPTSFWPRRPGVGWTIGQAVWALVAAGIIAAGVSQDLHHPGALAAGLVGVAVLWSCGAAVIATSSYSYRRWRRLP